MENSKECWQGHGKKAPELSEHEEQVRFVAFFRRSWPETQIIAIPNGGARNITTAARLKAEGVVRGVPDLFIPAWRFWIEMKRRKGGSLSPWQKYWLTYLSGCGYKAVACRGYDEAVSAALERYGEINHG